MSASAGIQGLTSGGFKCYYFYTNSLHWMRPGGRNGDLDLVNALVLTFTPLFVAIDAMGNVPIVLSLSSEMNKAERRRMVNIALMTAGLVGLTFLLVGRFVLRLLNIEVYHFAIGGGLVLFILSVRDLATGKMVDVPSKEEMLAVVPLGTPITVGPATLTTLIVLADSHSVWIVLASFALNMVATWAIFHQANSIGRFLGQGGLKAFSKVMSLLLAAIAVRIIISGVKGLFPGQP